MENRTKPMTKKWHHVFDFINQNKKLMWCFYEVHGVLMLSGNRDDIYTQHNIDNAFFGSLFWTNCFLWTTEMLVVHICIIQAEMKGNLMEKEFIKFDCYGRIWINLASIRWSCQNLYFGGKMRSESCFYITKNYVIYLSEDGFEFSLLGWSLLQQLNVRNKTKPPLKSHAAAHFMCMLPYENIQKM